MTDREKLVDLLWQCVDLDTPFGEIADHLLANGVIIPVQCKDCKHYVWDEWDGCYVCISLGRFVKPDFWCAYGERK